MSKTGLNTHMSSHPKCFTCGKFFFAEKEHKKHKLMHTTCDTCGKAFMTELSLNKHKLNH